MARQMQGRMGGTKLEWALGRGAGRFDPHDFFLWPQYRPFDKTSHSVTKTNQFTTGCVHPHTEPIWDLRSPRQFWCMSRQNLEQDTIFKISSNYIYTVHIIWRQRFTPLWPHCQGTSSRDQTCCTIPSNNTQISEQKCTICFINFIGGPEGEQYILFLFLLVCWKIMQKKLQYNSQISTKCINPTWDLIANLFYNWHTSALALRDPQFLKGTSRQGSSTYNQYIKAEQRRMWNEWKNMLYNLATFHWLTLKN